MDESDDDCRLGVEDPHGRDTKDIETLVHETLRAEQHAPSEGTNNNRDKQWADDDKKEHRAPRVAHPRQDIGLRYPDDGTNECSQRSDPQRPPEDAEVILVRHDGDVM